MISDELRDEVADKLRIASVTHAPMSYADIVAYVAVRITNEICVEERRSLSNMSLEDMIETVKEA